MSCFNFKNVVLVNIIEMAQKKVNNRKNGQNGIFDD